MAAARLPANPPAAPAALALVAVALVPLALLIAFYARELGIGPGEIVWDAVLLLAGGQVGIAATVLWSLEFGCVVAAALLATAPEAEEFEDGALDGGTSLRIRGPLSYPGRDRSVGRSRLCDDRRTMAEVLFTTRSRRPGRRRGRPRAARGARCRSR